jgi:hypothetical protein
LSYKQLRHVLVSVTLTEHIYTLRKDYMIDIKKINFMFTSFQFEVTYFYYYLVILIFLLNNDCNMIIYIYTV